MSLACLFSDWIRFSRKQSCLFWVDQSPTLPSASYLATLLCRKGDENDFPQKQSVRIKDNNNSPHGKFHRFLFPFSQNKFSDLNFASYVLYIYPCYVTYTHSKPGLPVVWWVRIERSSQVKSSFCVYTLIFCEDNSHQLVCRYSVESKSKNN